MKQYTITVEDQPYPGRTVWLCPGTGNGDGSASRPFRVQSPDDFDNLIKGYHGDNHKGSVAFRLMPGWYHTRGCWNHHGYATLWSGDALLGEAGVDIIIKDPVTQTDGKERPDVHILSAGSPYIYANRCRVEGVAIWGANIRPGLFVTSGLRCYGSYHKVSSVRVFNVYGSYEPVQTASGNIPLEAFGISFDGGGVVDDCCVDASQPKAYVSAFSGAKGGVSFRNCDAIGENQHAAFTIYSNCSVINSNAVGFAYGIYNDSEVVKNALVTGGTFECGRVGIGVVSVNRDYKSGIYVRDADFRSLDVLLELIGKDGMFDDILLDSCRYEYGKTGKATLFSADAKDVSLVRFRNCVVPDQLRVNNPNKVPYSVEGMMSWSGKRFLDTKPQGLAAMVEEA